MSDPDPPAFDELEFLLASDADTEAMAVANGNGSSNGKFYENIEEVPVEPELESEPIKIGDGSCKVCGEPTFRPPGLTKTGRLKRPPVYCDIHNPKVRDKDIPSPQQVEAQLRRIQSELADDVTLFGSLAGPFFPVTGMYIVDNAEDFTNALLTVFKNNPRVMRSFHRMAQVAPVYRLARFGAGVGRSVQVDKGQADPHDTINQRLGVSRAYDILYANSNSRVSSSPSDNANFNVNGPPRYATVQ